MDAGSLFITSTDNKDLTPEVRGQRPSASDKEESGADTFGTVLEQVETKSKQPPPLSESSQSDEPTKPIPAGHEGPAELMQASLQAGPLSQLMIMVQPVDVSASQGSDSQQGDTKNGANEQPALIQPTLFGESASQSGPSSQSQPTASVADVKGSSQTLTLAANPLGPTDQTQASVLADQAQAVTPADQALPKHDHGQLQSTQPAGSVQDVPASQIQNGTARSDSPLDGPRPGDQSGLSKSQALAGQSEPGASAALTQQAKPQGGQALAGAEEPNKAAAPDGQAVARARDGAEKSEAQNGVGPVMRSAAWDSNPAGSTWSEENEKGDGQDSGGKGLHQAIAGAERFLTTAAQAEVAGGKPVPAPQPANLVIAVPAEPATPKTISSIQVEVHPPELGEVQVRVTLADQTARANVTTQHAEVREFLVANQNRLEASFHAAGLDLDEFKVMVDQQERGQYGQLGHGWSYGSGRDTDGQGRTNQEQGSQADHRPESPAWSQARTWEGGRLSLFA